MLFRRRPLRPIPPPPPYSYDANAAAAVSLRIRVVRGRFPVGALLSTTGSRNAIDVPEYERSFSAAVDSNLCY